MLVGLVVGTLGGWINGFIVVKTKVASIAITLGTFAVYRGIAFILFETGSFSKYPQELSLIGQGYLFGALPVPLAIFLIAAAVSGILLHKTIFGKKIYLIGNSKEASLFSGIDIGRTRVICFAITGFLVAVASIILTFRNMNTRPNMAMNYEFEAITMVVIGGVSILGGKGRMIGVVLGAYFIGFSRNVLYILNIPMEVMKIILGLILILSIFVPAALEERRKRVVLARERRSPWQ